MASLRNSVKTQVTIIQNEARCKIFYCDKRRANSCCADCENYYKCNNHCLNSPNMCQQSYSGDSRPQKNLCAIKADIEVCQQ